MKFKLIENLIIVNMDGRDLLIDTGSPRSFALKESFPVKINDISYDLKITMASSIVLDALKHLLTVNVDGIIGNDIIIANSLSIDYLNEEIYFGLVPCSYDIEQYTMPLKTRMGLAYTELKSGSNTLDVILDTGSKMHYVKESYVDKTRSRGYFEDYSPDLGQMEGHLFDFYDSIHDETVTAGILPAVYNYACDMIMSVYLMARPGFCSFDFVKGEFKFTRRFI